MFGIYPQDGCCLTLRAISSILLRCHQRVIESILRSNCIGWTPTMQEGQATKGLMDTSFPPMILAFVATIVQTHCQEQVLNELVCFLKPQLLFHPFTSPGISSNFLPSASTLSLLSTATPRCVYLLGVNVFNSRSIIPHVNL